MELPLARGARALFYAFLACLIGFGVALICVGSRSTSVTAEYSYWLGSSDASAPILAIFSGCCIICLAVFGFVCALKEASTGLIIFACGLGVITVIEIVGGALAAAGSTKLTSSLQQRMDESMPLYPRDEDSKQAWDDLQLDMKCCGTYESRQWKEVFPAKGPPASCCPESAKQEVDSVEISKPSALKRFCQNKEKIFRRGCHRPLSAHLKTSMDEVAYVSLIFSFFQIFTMALASYLAYSIKRERNVKEAVVEVLKGGGESAMSRKSVRSEAPVATITVSQT